MRILSGGQTGADRAAFDAALALGIAIGGWVPQGRLDEEGTIPARYPGLREADSADPAVRSERNVRDADATLVLSHGELSGGSALTAELCEQLRRPLLHLDLARSSCDGRAQLTDWLARIQPQVLNVAGARHSEDPRLYAATYALLLDVLAAK